jgi:ribose transport system permease protein
MNEHRNIRCSNASSNTENFQFCSPDSALDTGSILRPDFFPSKRNFLSLFQEMSQLGIIAVGMTFVIINADIDLSVGSVMGLATANFAVMTNYYHWNAWLVAILVLIVGTFMGYINGILVTKGKLPAFIATLGMLFLARGLALLSPEVSKSRLCRPPSFFLFGAHNQILGGLNNQVLVLLVVGTIGSIVLRKTVFGYQIYSTGGNIQAAQFAGINTDQVRLWAFYNCEFLRLGSRFAKHHFHEKLLSNHRPFV